MRLAVTGASGFCGAALDWPGGAYNLADATAYRRDEAVGRVLSALGTPARLAARHDLDGFTAWLRRPDPVGAPSARGATDWPPVGRKRAVTAPSPGKGDLPVLPPATFLMFYRG